MAGLTKRQSLGLLFLLFLLFALPFGVVLVQRRQILKKKALVPSTLIVDSQETIATLSPFWRALAQGGEEETLGLSPIQKEVSLLRPRYIRIDHIFDFPEIVFRRRDGRIAFNWMPLDRKIYQIINTGAKPFLSLSYMPKTISVGNEVDLPRDWREWEFLIQKTIEHVSGREGLNLEGVYYEVWNEPDLFGRFTIGGEKDYRLLYLWAVRGAEKAREVNHFKIGGPATTFLNQRFIFPFLDFVATNNLRLDFLSWHVYSPDPGQVAREAEILSRYLGRYPSLLGVEKVVSEWGIRPEKNPWYEEEVSAAHAVATIARSAGKVNLLFTFEIKDGPLDFSAGWGLIKHETLGGKRKPRYFSLLLAGELEEQQIALFGGGSAEALATKNWRGEISLLLANYNSSPLNLPIVFNRLPNGFWRVDIRRLGEKEDSSQDFVVDSGVLTLSLFLEKNAVALLRLERQSPPLSFTRKGRLGYPGDRAVLITRGADLISYPLGGKLTASAGTVEMWFRPNWGGRERGEKVFFTISPIAGVTFGARKKDKGFSSQLEFGFFQGTSSAKTVEVNIGSWQRERWYHLAFVWDNRKGERSFLRIFIDGQLRGERLGSWRFPLGRTFYLGSDPTGGEKIDGLVDELRISSLPLSPPKKPPMGTLYLEHFDLLPKRLLR